MKMKLLHLLFVTLSITYTIAQEKNDSFELKRHEIKAGAIKLLSGPVFEGTYEYIYSRDFTFGSSLLININTDWYEDFSITPFARFYFQETKEYGAKGFFVEGFAKYSIGKYDKENDFLKDYSAAALGISLGKKWINKTGFVFEILFGFGRTLGNSTVAPDAIFRGDFNIGYRF